jgi:peroxiredoxin
MALQPGDLCPDLAFVRPDGTGLHLTELRGKPVLLIFLRHLA